MTVFEIAYAAESAAHEVAGGPAATLGINLKLLIAQLVNFCIVLVVLWRWVYTPLVRMLHERAQKIDQGLKDASAAAEHLTRVEKENEERIHDAQQKAYAIIARAKEVADEQHEKRMEEARQQSGELLERAKIEIEHSKTRMVAEAKQELGDLIIAATEKVLGKVLTAPHDRQIVESVIQEFRDARHPHTPVKGT